MRKLLIIYGILMLGALFVLLKISSGSTFEKRDMVSYNDTLHKAYADYAAGLSEAEIEKKYGCQLILSSKTDSAELTKLYSEYALVLDFAPEGETIGKIAWSDVKTTEQSGKNTFRVAAVIIWAIFCVLGLLLLLAVDYYLLRPNREMKAYAGEIAKGNLDVPLPIRRNNPFGNLTESFDLMREELRNSKAREAEAEKAKKELVAELAHDIKTPVATIRATCEVLELKQQRRLEQLKKKSDAAGVTQDAVTGKVNTDAVAEAEDVLSKTQTIAHKADTIETLMGTVFQATLEELDRIEVNPAEESSELIEEYFRNLRNYGTILLENHIPSCLVYMDRLRMEQVIDNVVGNSRKYADTDIHVRFSETAGKGKDGADVTYIKVRIKDDGPGAPEDELPLLTSKYYRGSTAKDKAGFGMGLYLVRSYMEKQGGGAEVYNDEGFVVELYLKKV